MSVRWICTCRSAPESPAGDGPLVAQLSAGGWHRTPIEVVACRVLRRDWPVVIDGAIGGEARIGMPMVPAIGGTPQAVAAALREHYPLAVQLGRKEGLRMMRLGQQLAKIGERAWMRSLGSTPSS